MIVNNSGKRMVIVGDTLPHTSKMQGDTIYAKVPRDSKLIEIGSLGLFYYEDLRYSIGEPFPQATWITNTLPGLIGIDSDILLTNLSRMNDAIVVNNYRK